MAFIVITEVNTNFIKVEFNGAQASPAVRHIDAVIPKDKVGYVSRKVGDKFTDIEYGIEGDVFTLSPLTVDSVNGTPINTNLELFNALNALIFGVV
jgi:hypothetical protein